MFEVRDAERWAAVFIALGALLPLALWLVRDALGPRLRNTATALAAVMLLVAGAGAVGRTAFLGYVLSPGAFGESDREAIDVVLAIAGLLLGLLVALAVRTGDDDVEDGEVDDLEELAVEEAPPVEEEPPLPAETIGTADEHWGSHVVMETAIPMPRASVGTSTYTLLLVALALALPVYRLGPLAGTGGLIRLREVDAGLVTMLVLEGLYAGLALLLPALALRREGTGAVVGSYALVAAGASVAAAWPGTFGNELWFMFATGLAAGLLLPAALRALVGSMAADRAAIAVGVATAIVLIAGHSAIQVRTTFGAADIGADFEDGDVSVVVPEASPFPTFEYPTDFPSFDLPTFEVPTFEVPTFSVPPAP